jgi:hypothetical protein
MFHSLIIVLLSIPSAWAVSSTTQAEGLVDHFDVPKEHFSSTGRNDYFVLEPFWQMTL